MARTGQKNGRRRAKSSVLLADRRVRHVGLALIASGVADGFLPVAMSFAVLRVTGSAAELGFILAMQSAVALLLTLAGGLAGDRFRRGRVLTVSLAVRLAVASAVAAALLTATASFAMLITMAAIYGCADGFFGPARVAILPEIVPRAQLSAANAVVGGSTSTLRIAAPALAGIIVAGLGPGTAFIVQAAILAIAVASLATARLPSLRHVTHVSTGAISELRAGWREFARHRWLWLLTGQWTVFSLVVLAPVAVLGPPIALHDLGGPAAWGLISSCLSFGAIAGQILAGRLKTPARPGLAIACLVPAMTGQALALGFGASLPTVAVVSAASGVAFGCQAVIFPTAMQYSVPPALLSRVTAIDLVGSEGGQPIGYALAGPIGQAVGAHTLLIAAASIMFVTSLGFPLLPGVRTQITPHAPSEP